MSDFLHRLISRTMGTAPILERRRPSIFEPTTNRTVPWFADETDQQENKGVGQASGHGQEFAPASGKSAHDFKVGAAQQPLAAMNERVHIVKAEEEGRQAMRIVPSQGVHPSAVKPVATERVVERVVDRIQQSTTMVEYRSDRAEYRELREIVHDRASVPPPPVREVQVIERPTEERASIGKEQTKAPLPISPALPVKTVQVVRAIPAPLPQATRRQRRESFVSEARTDTPAPIHVTIGKIEVRASKAVVPPVRRKVAPKLGLDEYLRGRSGGNR